MTTWRWNLTRNLFHCCSIPLSASYLFLWIILISWYKYSNIYLALIQQLILKLWLYSASLLGMDYHHLVWGIMSRLITVIIIVTYHVRARVMKRAVGNYRNGRWDISAPSLFLKFHRFLTNSLLKLFSNCHQHKHTESKPLNPTCTAALWLTKKNGSYHYSNSLNDIIRQQLVNSTIFVKSSTDVRLKQLVGSRGLKV